MTVQEGAYVPPQAEKLNWNGYPPHPWHVLFLLEDAGRQATVVVIRAADGADYGVMDVLWRSAAYDRRITASIDEARAMGAEVIQLRPDARN